MTMIGKIFITRTGYDPQLGRHVKDPDLGSSPSLGVCRPNIRRQVRIGDHIFVISGKVNNAKQFVMCGFEIVRKIDARDAYVAFPERRLRRQEDGQLAGNIIVSVCQKTDIYLNPKNKWRFKIAKSFQVR